MSKFGFGKAASVLGQQTKQAAILMMKASKQYFAEGFDKEQLDDKKWDEVKRRTQGTRFYEKRVLKVKNQPTGKYVEVDQGADWQTRKILKGTTGELRRKTVRADSSITNLGAVSVMTNPVRYAAFVNNGTPYMPARPFMKHTDELTIIHINILNTQTGKTWQKVP